MSGFDDPRGHESEEYASEAEHALRAGKHDVAHALFAKAAALEEKIVADVDPAAPRVRSVLALSAVALWFKANRFARSQTLARHLLAVGAVTEHGDIQEVTGLVRQAASKLAISRPASREAPPTERTRSYCELRDELEWRRASNESNMTTRAAALELERLWIALTEDERVEVELEIEALDVIDRTGEFLFDVALERIEEAGPRTAQGRS